ncbi:MAG: lipoate--protein ligase family protein [Proteobacteria bacterium]|nr:lipoate--protein ligase family protein [Pseudomonadota bacterium]
MLNNWRLILDPGASGAVNMATDAALLKSANEVEASPPTLRLYSWNSPTISVGYRQNPEDFEKFSLPVVKRLTGGRAVLHDSELTYSITVPRTDPLYTAGIYGAYATISRCIVSALKDVGVKGAGFVAPKRAARADRAAGSVASNGTRARKEACFLSSSRYEIVVEGKKMVGSAQRRFAGGLLQHGSILVGVERAPLEAVFGPGLIDKITWLGAESTATVAQLSEALVGSFAVEFGTLTEAGLTDAEKGYVAQELDSSEALIKSAQRAG